MKASRALTVFLASQAFLAANLLLKKGCEARGQNPFTVSVQEPFTVSVEKPAAYIPKLPKGAWQYKPARYTQRIATTNNRPTIQAVPIALMPDVRWHQSGGMLGIKGWRSEKWKWTPKAEKEWVGAIAVKNSFGDYQTELGLRREYPVGTQFHDVLYNSDSGLVFEHRVRKKDADGWNSFVEYRDEKARPQGYKGLSVTCRSCHSEPGTGGYAVGLVPGADTVFSDPWDWDIARGYQ